MYKHWGLHISSDINCLSIVLGSFWAVWRGLLLSLEAKHWSWQFLRYQQFNMWYHGGYLLICSIAQPILIVSRHDWYQSKGLFKGFWVSLRLWELSNNWWRYGQMKFVTVLLNIHNKSVRKANSKPELSQLLFISIRQRELIRVLAALGLSTYTTFSWSVHSLPVTPTKLCDIMCCDMCCDMTFPYYL